MSSRRNNFQTFFDEYHQVSGNFDHHHHVVASPPPSLHYSVHSGANKHTQYQQNSKMPGLLRLDSVGEVSSVQLPADRNSKPLLRNCKSADYETNLPSRRNKFSSKSNMASVKKSLTSSPSKFHYGGLQMSAPVFAKANSFSQMSQLQLDSPTSRLSGFKNLSSSFDFSHHGSVPDNMHSPLIRTGINDFKTLFGSSGAGVSTANPVTPVSFISSSSIFSTIAAKCTQLISGCSDSVLSKPFSVTEEKDHIPCQASLFNFSKLHNGMSTAASLQSQKTASNQTLDKSDANIGCSEIVAEERSLSTDESPLSSEYLMQLPHDNCQRSRYSDALKRDSDRKITFDETSHSPLKATMDHSSVLSAPRKITKKGRPSLKKQKKRRREKHRHEYFHSEKEFSTSSPVLDKADEKHAHSQLEELDSSALSFETSHSPLQNSISTESSSVKAKSKCPIASLFFGRMSTNLEETDDDSDNCEGSDEWSINEDSSMYISPINCPGLNVALNLDVIFKKKNIPSLKSIFKEECDSDSESLPLSSSATDYHCQISVLNTSKDDSFEDSVECDAPLSSSELKCFGLTTGLSLDSLFTKKSCLSSPAAVQISESTFDVVDGLSSSDNSHNLSRNLESCLEAIREINAKWDEDYPTAGFRSCQSVSTDEIKDSSIKVHFAAAPNLLTVHMVGTEDRAGTWRIDRERFERRILDLQEVISPILEASHRAKILEQNQIRRSVELNK